VTDKTLFLVAKETETKIYKRLFQWKIESSFFQIYMAAIIVTTEQQKAFAAISELIVSITEL